MDKNEEIRYKEAFIETFTKNHDTISLCKDRTESSATADQVLEYPCRILAHTTQEDNAHIFLTNQQELIIGILLEREIRWRKYMYARMLSQHCCNLKQNA